MVETKDSVDSAPEEVKSETVKPQTYVLIRHMQRSAVTRTQRKTRAGGRYTALVLGDGTRIRRRGPGCNEIGLDLLLENHENILELLKGGMVEILTPSEQPMSYDEVAQLVQQLGKDMGGKDFRYYGDEVTTLVPRGDETKRDIDTSALIAAVDQAEARKTGKANEPPSEREEVGDQDLEEVEDVQEPETKVMAPRGSGKSKKPRR